MGGKGSGRKPELPTVPAVVDEAAAEKAAKRYRVESPNKRYVSLMSEQEQKFYRDLKSAYLKEFGFTNYGDLEALGRILLQETLAFRYGVCLSQNIDVHGQVLSPALAADYRRSMSDAEKQVSGMKRDLGMIRERVKEDDPAVYLQRLLKNAKAFGVVREKQLIEALVQMNQIISDVEAFDRSNETERIELGLRTEKDIVDRLRERFPKFKAIDEHFVKNEQRYWTSE